MSRLALVALLLTMACAPEVPDDTEEVMPDRPLPGASESGGSDLADAEQCDAEAYRPLLGTPASETSFPIGPDLRVFGVNDIVTQDFLPMRTNIVTDEAGQIMRIYCG